MFEIRRGNRVSDLALDAVIATRRASALWWPTASGYREIATAALALAGRRATEGPTDLQLAAVAAAASRQGLVRAPIDPAGWLRLAWLARAEGSEAMAARLLAASFETGPYYPELAPARAKITLALWQVLTPHDRMAAGREIERLWQTDPDALLRLTSDRRAAIAVASALRSRDAIFEFFRRRRAGP
jgi:hypothetical protein